MRPGRISGGLGQLTLIVALILASPAWAKHTDKKYTDTIILKNGDQITGNVKSLAQGQLSFDTDAMGTVSIEWTKVAEILSSRPMVLVTTGGKRHFGEIERPPEEDEVRIKTTKAVETLSVSDVVHITPIGQSFWSRIQGSLSAGFNFTESSDVAQFSLSGEALYRARRHQLGISFTNIITGQQSGTTEQLDSALTYRHYLKDRWFGTGALSFQRNQELGIDARGLIAAGIGRQVIQSSHGGLALSTGLDLNVEDTTSGQDTSGEMFGTLSYSLWKYEGNQRNLVIKLTAFPSLTEWGRFRWQFNTRWNQELFHNFNFGLTFYGSGDNEPPTGATASSDYGVITSLGWSFGP